MSIKIDQAFIQAFIDGAFGLPIAHENSDYSPAAQTAYAELLNLPNDITAFSLNDSNETDGLFRIILRWPENEGSINAKTQADTIMSAFGIGTDVCYSGQCATIVTQDRGNGFNEEGWYKILITIGYYANITR